jgi:RNA polymerase sigma factor (sigma-70 family)
MAGVRQDRRGTSLHDDPNDETRFRALWEAHAGAVRAYAIRQVGPDASGDVVAETFLVAWRRLHDVPEAARPWLFGVARRVIANHRRAGDRRQALVARLGRQAPGRPAPKVGGEEAADTGAALARLSEPLRQAITLVVLDGLSRDEAARVLQCTTATLAVRLHRARRRLARELDRSAENRGSHE